MNDGARAGLGGRAWMAGVLAAVVLAVALTAWAISRGGDDVSVETESAKVVVFKPAHDVSASILEEAAAVMRRRLANAEVDDARVSVDSSVIRVQVEESRDLDDVRRLAALGELRFRPVLGMVPPEGADPPTTPPADDRPDIEVVLADAEGSARYRLGPTMLTGSVVEGASARFDQLWFVQLQLTRAGSPQFDEMAAGNQGRQIAIVVDSVVLSAPLVQSASFDGLPTITGDFTEREVRDLAAVLDSGALPVGLEETSVSGSS